MEKTLKEWLKRIKLHESTISMLLGAFVVVLVGSLLYNYFSSLELNKDGDISEEASSKEYALEIEESDDGKQIPKGLPVKYEVSKGEDLWKISEKFYGNGYNWTDIALENSIQNPNLIVAGQELIIPKAELRVKLAETEILTTQSSLQSIKQDTYIVKKGDTLWNIAVRAYQDGYQWPAIYRSNTDVISDPNYIESGLELKIPRNN